MQYRTLGRTGIKASPYALGAMMFDAVGNPAAGWRTPYRSSVVAREVLTPGLARCCAGTGPQAPATPAGWSDGTGFRPTG